MEYEIKSKPTIYNGTKFRSRLEARWAAFFDLIGWRYQYEPFDLHGWTPDFQVYGTEGRYILFEVKPYIDFDVRVEYFYKISKAADITGETEFDLKPPCIIISEIVQGCEYSKHVASAGYQITPWGHFEVQWKDNQDGVNSEYDIGSMLMNFDGLLWKNDSKRKLFLETGPAFDRFMSLWIEAGELSRFHYHG